MKRRPVLIVICFILILALSQLFTSYYNFKTNQVVHSSTKDVELYLESIVYESENLSDFVDFEWDTVHVIGPYTPNKHKHETVGDIWYTNSSYFGYLIDKYIFYSGEILSDEFQELVFTDHGKVVSTALLLRSYGDFLHNDQRVYSNSDANFIIEIDEYSYKRVEHVN